MCQERVHNGFEDGLPDPPRPTIIKGLKTVLTFTMSNTTK